MDVEAVEGGLGQPAVIGDVARRAGVSVMTVSRVANDREGVSASTRERVLAAMEELGYRPNAAARALVTGRSRVLGAVCFDVTYYGPAATLAAIEQAARDAGYTVRIVTLRGPSERSPAEVARDLAAGGACGVVFAAPHDWTAAALPHLPARFPVVGIDVDLAQASAPVVGFAQEAGARRAVRYLLDLGHASVWHVAGPESWPSARLREKAWRGALTERGRTVPAVLRGDWSARSGYEQGLRLAEHSAVTAVFAANDQMALGVLRALRERGLDVPGQVSVIGFDDIPESGYFCPPLTTLRQDFGRAARRALDVLVAQIDGAPCGNRLDVVEPELVVRASTAPPPEPGAAHRP